MIKEFETYLSSTKGYSDNTVMSYSKDLRDFVKYCQRNHRNATWRTITAEMVQMYVVDLKVRGKQATTIKRHVSSIRSIYTWMRIKGLVTENPARYTETPKAGKRLPNTIDVKAIAAAINNPAEPLKTRTMLAILTETGMRLQEMLDMHLSNVDTKYRSIRVIGKGNKERVVYYGDLTAQLLSSYSMVKNGQLFSDNQRETRYAIYETLSRYTSARQLSPHAIRHTYATKMLENGADIKALAELMGHESVKTTERYTHLSQVSIKQQYQLYNPTKG